MARVRSLTSPYVPYVTKASSMVYGKNRLVDDTLTSTLSRVEQLSQLTMEKVQTHVPAAYIEQLDEFGCHQLDRLSALSTQGNEAVTTTYTWCKDRSTEALTKVADASNAVKTTVNATVDKYLPEEEQQEESGSEPAAVPSLTDIGTKVYTRAAPIVNDYINTDALKLHLSALNDRLHDVLPEQATTRVDLLTEYLSAYATRLQGSAKSTNKYVEVHMGSVQKAMAWAYGGVVNAPVASAEAPVATAPNTPVVSFEEEEVDDDEEQDFEDAADASQDGM
jgi:hypothetical protein